jgi:threonylcarbamoyladenosine tRNA methylthiotransferase MtaB
VGSAITNVRIVRSHLLEGFPSDELNNVLKNAYEISQQNIKEIVLTGNIGLWKRIWEQKTNILLELVQELDKVEGIERLRISSKPNLLKNETIEFVSNRTFVPHFISLQSEVTRF